MREKKILLYRKNVNSFLNFYGLYLQYFNKRFGSYYKYEIFFDILSVVLTFAALFFIEYILSVPALRIKTVYQPKVVAKNVDKLLTSAPLNRIVLIRLKKRIQMFQGSFIQLRTSLSNYMKSVKVSEFHQKYILQLVNELYKNTYYNSYSSEDYLSKFTINQILDEQFRTKYVKRWTLFKVLKGTSPLDIVIHSLQLLFAGLDMGLRLVISNRSIVRPLYVFFGIFIWVNVLISSAVFLKQLFFLQFYHLSPLLVRKIYLLTLGDHVKWPHLELLNVYPYTQLVIIGLRNILVPFWLFGGGIFLGARQFLERAKFLRYSKTRSNRLMMRYYQSEAFRNQFKELLDKTCGGPNSYLRWVKKTPKTQGIYKITVVNNPLEKQTDSSSFVYLNGLVSSFAGCVRKIRINNSNCCVGLLQIRQGILDPDLAQSKGYSLQILWGILLLTFRSIFTLIRVPSYLLLCMIEGQFFNPVRYLGVPFGTISVGLMIYYALYHRMSSDDLKKRSQKLFLISLLVYYLAIPLSLELLDYQKSSVYMQVLLGSTLINRFKAKNLNLRGTILDWAVTYLRDVTNFEVKWNIYTLVNLL